MVEADVKDVERGKGRIMMAVARRARLSRDVMYTFRQAVEIATLV